MIIGQIRQKLEQEFSPLHLQLFDESHKHAGHSGNPQGKSETHIGIVIVSEAFTGKTRLQRSRMVHSAIADEIRLIHALTLLRHLSPAEWEEANK